MRLDAIFTTDTGFPAQPVALLCTTSGSILVTDVSESCCGLFFRKDI